MIPRKPPRRRVPIVPSGHADHVASVPMRTRNASPAASPVNPSGDARPVVVRIVPPPPREAVLYARGEGHESMDLTGSGVLTTEGDALLVQVPAWTRRLLAIVDGEVVADVDLPSRGERPAGELALFGTAPILPSPSSLRTPGRFVFAPPGEGGGGGEGPPVMRNVRLRGVTLGAGGGPSVVVLVDGADGTRASLADGRAARWDGADWLFGIASSIRSVRVRYPDGSARDLALPNAAPGTEVLLEVPAPPAPLPMGVRARNAVPGSRFFVGSTDVTVMLPTPDGRAARWEGADWLFGVPAGTRVVRVRYPDGSARDLALPAARAGDSVAVDAAAPATASPPARINVRVRGLRRGADGLPTTQLFVGEEDATAWALANGDPARWDGDDWIISVPRTTREVRLRYPSGSVGTAALAVPTEATREFLVEAAEDAQALVVDDGSGPLEIAPTSTLAFVRVWLIDPPNGTRLYRSPSAPAASPDELSGYGTDIAGAVALPGSGRASVPVYEYRLPDTADGSIRTVAVWAVLPDGTRIDVPLSPVPSDGILRVDLSRHPGTRSATIHGADDGGVGLGTVAVVAAGLAGAGWLALRGRARGRRAGDDARDNPSRSRKARRRGRR